MRPALFLVSSQVEALAPTKKLNFILGLLDDNYVFNCLQLDELGDPWGPCLSDDDMCLTVNRWTSWGSLGAMLTR